MTNKILEAANESINKFKKEFKKSYPLDIVNSIKERKALRKLIKKGNENDIQELRQF